MAVYSTWTNHYILQRCDTQCTKGFQVQSPHLKCIVIFFISANHAEQSQTKGILDQVLPRYLQVYHFFYLLLVFKSYVLKEKRKQHQSKRNFKKLSIYCFLETFSYSIYCLFTAGSKVKAILATHGNKMQSNWRDSIKDLQ